MSKTIIEFDKLIEALKFEGSDIRLTNRYKWLVWFNNYWVVFYKGYNDKKVRTLIQTDNIEEALKVLLED